MNILLSRHRRFLASKLIPLLLASIEDKSQDNMEDPEGKETKRYATFGTETSEDSSKGSRERWSSRLAFYLAAIGSAIGFGNIWRFPALAKDYGGGAFFIPYFIALLVIGIPVLVLEISLGQFHQTGNVGVFGTFHARFRGVGVSAVACAYMLAVYYSMLLSWVTRAFFDSWSPEAPWTDEGVTGEEAVTYFTNVSSLYSRIGTGTISSNQSFCARYAGYHRYGNAWSRPSSNPYRLAKCWILSALLAHRMGLPCVWPQMDWSHHLL